MSKREQVHQNFIMLLSGFLVVALAVMSMVLLKQVDEKNMKPQTDEAQAIKEVSAKDDVYTLEMELKGTNLDQLDYEVPLIEKELSK